MFFREDALSRTHIIARFVIGIGLATVLGAFGCSSSRTIDPFPDEFVGAGVELTIEDEFPVVVRAIVGSSAAQAGIEPEDRIVAINGESTEGMPLPGVVTRIRGRPQTQLQLTLERADGQRITTVLVRRAVRT